MDKILFPVIVSFAIVGFLAPLIYNDGKHDKIYESKSERLESLESQTVIVRSDKTPVDIYAMREPFSSDPLITYSSMESSPGDS